MVSASVDVTTDGDLDEYIKPTVGEAFHPLRNVMMPPKDSEWGVVNPHLRIKGGGGLRVVDTSIFQCS